jgi:hypothetical protein
MLFIGYTLAVLVDLVVINLFDEYWDWVSINSFTISLAAAVLMQVLLKATLALEHRVADHFKKKEGRRAKVMRGITTYAILVLSKFVILEAFNWVFGERVMFTGPWHGLVAFVVLVAAILLAEFIVGYIYRRLKSNHAAEIS